MLLSWFQDQPIVSVNLFIWLFNFIWHHRGSSVNFGLPRVWIVAYTPVLPLLHNVGTEQLLPHLFEAVPAKRTFVFIHLCTYTDSFFNTRRTVCVGGTLVVAAVNQRKFNASFSGIESNPCSPDTEIYSSGAVSLGCLLHTLKLWARCTVGKSWCAAAFRSQQSSGSLTLMGAWCSSAAQTCAVPGPILWQRETGLCRTWRARSHLCPLGNCPPWAADGTSCWCHPVPSSWSSLLQNKSSRTSGYTSLSKRQKDQCLSTWFHHTSSAGRSSDSVCHGNVTLWRVLGELLLLLKQKNPKHQIFTVACPSAEADKGGRAWVAQRGSWPVPHHEEIRVAHLAGIPCRVCPGPFSCSGDSLLSITAVHPTTGNRGKETNFFSTPTSLKEGLGSTPGFISYLSPSPATVLLQNITSNHPHPWEPRDWTLPLSWGYGWDKSFKRWISHLPESYPSPFPMVGIYVIFQCFLFLPVATSEKNQDAYSDRQLEEQQVPARLYDNLSGSWGPQEMVQGWWMKVWNRIVTPQPRH